MKHKNTKRKYEKKLIVRLNGHEDFLVAHLRKEWEMIERMHRREKFLDMTMQAGITLGKTLLVLAVIGGALTIAVVAPNIFAGVGRMRRYRGYFEKKRFNQALQYLRRQKYVAVAPADDGNIEIALSEIGKKKVLQHAFGELRIVPEAKKWDGKWRVVVFDIPERHKWAREGLRDKLKLMGFFRLQDSVFVFPHPCEEEIRFLCSLYSVEPYVHMMEAVVVDDDSEFRRYFSLEEK